MFGVSSGGLTVWIARSSAVLPASLMPTRIVLSDSTVKEVESMMLR